MAYVVKAVVFFTVYYPIKILCLLVDFLCYLFNLRPQLTGRWAHLALGYSLQTSVYKKHEDELNIILRNPSFLIPTISRPTMTKHQAPTDSAV